MSGLRTQHPPLLALPSPSPNVLPSVVAPSQALDLNSTSGSQSHIPSQREDNPFTHLDKAGIMLRWHYMLGGSWWNFDLDKLLTVDKEPEPSHTSTKNQKENPQQEMNELDEDGDETDMTSVDGNTKQNGHDKHARNKKKSKSKSKKKSKRGHGKRNKTKDDLELENERPQRSTRTDLEESGNSSCRPIPTRSGPSNSGVTDNITNIENSELAGQGAVWAGSNGYPFWKQFSCCPTDCGMEDQTQICTKCGIKSNTLVICRRCQLARYCSKSCERRDARRHKPLCLRVFAFHAARKSIQPTLDWAQTLTMKKIKRPPISYFLGSIPDGTRYNVLPSFHPPVLLEIIESRHTPDFRVWILTVKDIANKTTKVIIQISIEDFDCQDTMSQITQLVPGNFIVVLNASWTVGGTAEDCLIKLKHEQQYFIVHGVDLSKF